MQATLDQITDIFSGITGRQSPKVKRYLDGLTYTSVYESLDKLLSWQRRGGLDMSAVFDTHCFTSPNQRPCWNEESFRKHVRCSFPESVIPDFTVRLLWRSFAYYAYHPFPGLEQDVDFAAFTRAIFFLVYQCDELFGTQEFATSDMFFLHTPWRSEGGADWRRIRIERLLRSIDTPCSNDIELNRNKTEPILLDAMDVLCVVSPEFIHFGLTPEQLEIVARRLLNGAMVQTELTKGNLETLKRLLERVVVREETWGLFGKKYCYGDIAACGSKDSSHQRADEYLFQSDIKEPISIENAITGLNMPDLDSRYYQLWAILFQPPMFASGNESTQTMGNTIIEADDKNRMETEKHRGSVGLNPEDGARVLSNDLKKRIQGFGSF
ncbi:hypothetical protein ONS95_008400 [Cadophora gregata]|uniref:uncharacterized protein n=1 Tax=Cadophora gregata TaxID=51156 RepID=UPI0026DCFD5B|nr:uncharacterized protein ONS95_008400 [Cadophora gregata]KAK0100450.1 hypothetical protein ONS96_007726 [Cadophora gregata f. sp. sojae]KAK0126821.1 hypothetical protein ONS95_008400 [Cadophora gregata]